MTRHSIERTIERAHLNERAAKKMILKATAFGIDPDEFSAKERNYLNHLSDGNKKAKYYNGYCFIIASESICVTMYPVPKWFGKRSNFDGKTQVRNPKKYFGRYYIPADPAIARDA